MVRSTKFWWAGRWDGGVCVAGRGARLVRWEKTRFGRVAWGLAALALCLTSAARADETFNFANVRSDYPQGDPRNQQRSATATAPGFVVNSVQVTGALRTLRTYTPASYARVLLYNSDHTGATQYREIQLFNDKTLESGVTYTGSKTFHLGDLAGLTINPGSIWNFSFYSANDDVPNVNDALWTNISFVFKNEAVAPPPAIDLGIISAANSGLSVTTGDFIDKEVKWFKFTVGDVNDSLGTYLDLFTSAGIAAVDTQFGLYASDGRLIASDDDDGTGSFSALSFGVRTPPRPGNGNGVAFNGRDGGLSAGAYYLAVSHKQFVQANDRSFYPGFDAVSYSQPAAGFRLNFNANVAVPEPGSITILALGGVAFLFQRRRKDKR